jgi:hypothetical protein
MSNYLIGVIWFGKSFIGKEATTLKITEIYPNGSVYNSVKMDNMLYILTSRYNVEVFMSKYLNSYIFWIFLVLNIKYLASGRNEQHHLKLIHII